MHSVEVEEGSEGVDYSLYITIAVSENEASVLCISVFLCLVKTNK